MDDCSNNKNSRTSFSAHDNDDCTICIVEPKTVPTYNYYYDDPTSNDNNNNEENDIATSTIGNSSCRNYLEKNDHLICRDDDDTSTYQYRNCRSVGKRRQRPQGEDNSDSKRTSISPMATMVKSSTSSSSLQQQQASTNPFASLEALLMQQQPKEKQPFQVTAKMKKTATISIQQTQKQLHLNHISKGRDGLAGSAMNDPTSKENRTVNLPTDDDNAFTGNFNDQDNTSQSMPTGHAKETTDTNVVTNRNRISKHQQEGTTASSSRTVILSNMSMNNSSKNRSSMPKSVLSPPKESLIASAPESIVGTRPRHWGTNKITKERATANNVRPKSFTQQRHSIPLPQQQQPQRLTTTSSTKETATISSKKRRKTIHHLDKSSSLLWREMTQTNNNNSISNTHRDSRVAEVRHDNNMSDSNTSTFSFLPRFLATQQQSQLQTQVALTGHDNNDNIDDDTLQPPLVDEETNCNVDQHDIFRPQQQQQQHDDKNNFVEVYSSPVEKQRQQPARSNHNTKKSRLSNNNNNDTEDGPLMQRLNHIRGTLRGETVRLLSGQYPFSARNGDRNDPRNRAETVLDVTILGSDVHDHQNNDNIIHNHVYSYLMTLPCYVHSWVTNTKSKQQINIRPSFTSIILTYDTIQTHNVHHGTQLRIYNALYIPGASSNCHHSCDNGVIVCTQLCEPYPKSILPSLELPQADSNLSSKE